MTGFSNSLGGFVGFSGGFGGGLSLGKVILVDVLAGAYADVQALSPVIMMQFRYPVYEGTRVLFQDAACTTPVTTVNDPIGGVKDPFTGNIVATQANTSRRPKWGGSFVGAVFDGTDDGLDVSIGQASSYSFIFGSTKANPYDGNIRYLFRAENSGNSSSYQARTRSNTRIQVVASDDSGGQFINDNLYDGSSIDYTESHQLALSVQNTGGGTVVHTRAVDNLTVVDNESISDTHSIDSSLLGNINVGSTWDGKIAELVFFDSSLGGDELVEINSILANKETTTVYVRQITNWADAGTGAFNGALLLLTNTSNQDAIFQWDQAGSEWQLVTTFDQTFTADSTVDANLYPTDFRGTQDFRNPPPDISGGLSLWDFRANNLAPGDVISSVTDLLGLADATQGANATSPRKGTQSGFPGEYGQFDDDNDVLEAGTKSTYQALHEGDGFIIASFRLQNVTTDYDFIVMNSAGSGNIGVMLYRQENNILFRITDGSGSFVFLTIQIAHGLSADTWHTFGVSWEGTTLKFWKDGVQLGSDFTINSNRASGLATYPMHIGESPNGNFPFGGDMQAVFVGSGGHPSTAEVAAFHEWALG